MGLYHYPGFFARGRSELAAAHGVYQWISVNVARDSALLYDNDPMLYLCTGRHSSRLGLPPRLVYVDDWEGLGRFVNSAGEYARTHGLSYVVLGRSGDQRSIGGQVATDLPGLRLVHETPRLSIYAVK